MPTIGEQLKQARENRRLTILQAMEATRIRDYYLQAMEADDFSKLPSALQARGFLRSYASFLGLDTDALIEFQHSQNTLPAELNPPANGEAEPVPQAAVTPEPPPAPLPEPEPEPLPVEVEPPQPPAPPAISQLIFFEIGHELRVRRELLSLTLDEIERHTRVRKHYLEKIEAGNFDELPSPVQARGMLSNYASFLDVDPEATLLRFAMIIASTS